MDGVSIPCSAVWSMGKVEKECGYGLQCNGYHVLLPRYQPIPPPSLNTDFVHNCLPPLHPYSHVLQGKLITPPAPGMVHVSRQVTHHWLMINMRAVIWLTWTIEIGGEDFWVLMGKQFPCFYLRASENDPLDFSGCCALRICSPKSLYLSHLHPQDTERNRQAGWNHLVMWAVHFHIVKPVGFSLTCSSKHLNWSKGQWEPLVEVSSRHMDFLSRPGDQAVIWDGQSIPLLTLFWELLLIELLFYSNTI